MIFSSYTNKLDIWGDEGAYCSADELTEFRKEVENEIKREEDLILKVKSRSKGQITATLFVCVLIIIGAGLIYYKPTVLFLWLVVGILLYSYNFVILLIPTTTVEKTKIKDRIDVQKLYVQFKEIAMHLILKKRRLAIEVGLTVFLGGMVPLALSFSVIFAIGLVYAINFGFLTNIIGMKLAGRHRNADRTNPALLCAHAHIGASRPRNNKDRNLDKEKAEGGAMRRASPHSLSFRY